MSTATYTGPLYFEDHLVGTVRETGFVTVTEDAIIEFETRYDPQSFHIDKEAASQSIYGGLIASGWHTASMCMRLLVVDGYISPAGMGSPGIDALRWIKPVRPGDKLRARGTLIEARRSRSKPDRGLLRTQFEVFNQNQETVMTWIGLTFIKCRERVATTEPFA
jgi:acyl dehydratase